MSRRCKHPPDHVVIKYDCDGLSDPLELSWRECLDCGAWFPLGPSNDDDERVKVEIKLATHIQEVCLLWEPKDQHELIERYVDGFANSGHRTDCEAPRVEELRKVGP